MRERPDPARSAQASRLRGFWDALHAGASTRRDHGLLRRCLCRLLPLPAAQRRGGDGRAAVTMSSRFMPQCPLPDRDGAVIELAHGGGGLLTHRLIEDVFRPAFGARHSDFTHDGAVFEIAGQRFAFTTDSYVVRPLFFPGGDIGSLAGNGTVNDLAMCAAEPQYLSAGFVLEEGFALDDLRRIVRSMQAAAELAGVKLVTGDTKVVERGQCDGLYINTTGIGQVAAGVSSAPQNVRPGDAVLLSGYIGRHGIAVMSVREGLAFESPIASDCAPLAATVKQLIDAAIPL